MRILSGLILIPNFWACQEESNPQPQPPAVGNGLEVKTDEASLRYESGKFSVAGSVLSLDGFSVIQKGICFGTASLPKIQTDSVQFSGGGFGNFTTLFSLPDVERDWFLRSFAITTSTAGKTDTTYGNQIILKPYHQIKTVRLSASGTDSIRISWDGLKLCGINGLQSILSKGVCWGVNPNPKPENSNFTFAGLDTSAFNFSVTGLQAGKLYYFRAFAATQADTVFGLNTGCSTGLLDADGNFYPTILLGKQVWLGANLRVGRFSDGTPVEENPDNARWDTTTNPAFASSADNQVFGKLYNYYCISSEKNLCPDGWKVPSRQDWDTLFRIFGGWENAGLALKSGTTAWGSKQENQGSSGFNALPAGKKQETGELSFSGKLGFWWMSPDNAGPRFFRMTNLDKGVFLENASVNQGVSVRCIRK